MGWIFDHSFGLPQVGVQKLSESVRAYVFLTLSLQSSTCCSIIGKDRRALDAQSIWRLSLEELVKSDSSTNDKIHRDQDVLQYGLSKVDFNVGEGVYMLPSNLVLAMGSRTGLNNMILVPDSSFTLGINKPVNLVVSMTAPKSVFTASIAKDLSKLPYGELVVAAQHKDEMAAISILSVATTVLLLYLFK